MRFFRVAHRFFEAVFFHGGVVGVYHQLPIIHVGNALFCGFFRGGRRV